MFKKNMLQGGGIKGIIYGEHVFLPEATSDGATRLTHNDDFTGLFVGFADLPPATLVEGYNRMNSALKHIVERAANTTVSAGTCW